ncbi:MOSC domain-containing protein [Shewanella maritima]|uniref:MOSC domain-containing protein n=1 Tax=Shewanella maritima TaxID=2520507 RepID=A0A411PHG7_9GAMM|nr:MOSC domain-containing protein [Shewanella maritima]QBF82938.1 MOSC domain-containing protein [Shewanella maritima]
MSKQLVSRLSGLYLGDKQDNHDGVSTTINQKRPAKQLIVTHERIQGNGEADPKHHGGVDRVIHHFPREHYGQYRRWDLISGVRDAPTMGENISTVGVNEAQVNIGDIVRFGDVVLQVTQPRSPCFKLNLQFNQPQFALAMQETALCGWFYKVIEAGTIDKSDSMELIERRSDISLAEAMRIYFLPQFDANQYQRLLDSDGLAQSWVNSLQNRLDMGSIEPWDMRLYGPQGKPKLDSVLVKTITNYQLPAHDH